MNKNKEMPSQKINMKFVDELLGTVIHILLFVNYDKQLYAQDNLLIYDTKSESFTISNMFRENQCRFGSKF